MSDCSWKLAQDMCNRPSSCLLAHMSDSSCKVAQDLSNRPSSCMPVSPI